MTRLMFSEEQGAIYIEDWIRSLETNLDNVNNPTKEYSCNLFVLIEGKPITHSKY